ncbi:MAG: TetR family transcriptional regulator [Hyphomonadaceae bacterium]
MSALLDTETREALAKAALAVAAQKPWREATLADLAGAAGRPIADFYPAAMADAVECAEEGFDRAMAEGEIAPNASVRDRLFDLIMRRFEAMEPHRAAVLAMEAGQDRDPVAMGAAHQRHVRAARWALTLAGLEADGMSGNARAQGLGVIIGQARAAWRGDADGDFAKTMASLDKNLRRAEEMFGRFAGFEKKSKAPEADASATEAS